MAPLFLTAFGALFLFFCAGDDKPEIFEPALPVAPDFFLIAEVVRGGFFLGDIGTDLFFLLSADALALIDSFFFFLRSSFTEKVFFAGIPNIILVRSFFSIIRSLFDFLFLGVAINFTSRSDFLILSTVSLTASAKGST